MPAGVSWGTYLKFASLAFLSMFAGNNTWGIIFRNLIIVFTSVIKSVCSFRRTTFFLNFTFFSSFPNLLLHLNYEIFKKCQQIFVHTFLSFAIKLNFGYNKKMQIYIIIVFFYVPERDIMHFTDSP